MPAALTVSTLTDADIRLRLAEPQGLGLRIGPVGLRIRSGMPAIWQGLPSIYGHYPLLQADEFADFRVSVNPPGMLRRFVRPQAQFYLGRAAPFLPLPAHHALAMLEWGLNWCVTASLHRYVVIHAAAVERDGLAYIFPGEPGSGKSTLAASLMLAGWRLLTDELVLLDTRSGLIQPFPRPVGLKNASIGVIQADAPHAVMGPLVKDTAKGLVGHLRPTLTSVERSGETARPAAVVFPRFALGARPALTEREPHETFLALINQSFNYQIVGEPAFLTLAGLVGRVPSYAMGYGSLNDGRQLVQDLHARLTRH